jgi:hypothetical protein
VQTRNLNINKKNFKKKEEEEEETNPFVSLLIEPKKSKEIEKRDIERGICTWSVSIIVAHIC